MAFKTKAVDNIEEKRTCEASKIEQDNWYDCDFILWMVVFMFVV